MDKVRLTGQLDPERRSNKNFNLQVFCLPVWHPPRKRMGKKGLRYWVYLYCTLLYIILRISMDFYRIYLPQGSQRGGVWSLSEWIVGTPNLQVRHPVL